MTHPVSHYANARTTFSTQSDLWKELNAIKSGIHRVPVEECRAALNNEGKSKYNELKSKLPAVTFCGLFDGAHKATQLKHYNSLVIIDIDGVEESDCERFKNVIFGEPFVIACWISPSGRGIKALIKTAHSKEYHKLYFDQIVKYFASNHSLEIDRSGSDICRLCYVSYDPTLLARSASECFPFVEELIQLKKVEVSDKTASQATEYIEFIAVSDRVLFYQTEGRNLRKDKENIIKIIKVLGKNGKSITKSYHDWFRVGLAIANSFTYDVGKKFYLELCRLDGINHDEYKSEFLLDYCYRNRRKDQVTFATIMHLASDQGFTPVLEKGARVKGKVD